MTDRYSHYTNDKEGLSYWVEQVFYAGIELSVLSTPALIAAVLLQVDYPDAIPLAGLSALFWGTIGLVLFRNRVVDVGPWPRLGEFASAPLRIAHFSVVFGAACVGVGIGAVAAGSLAWTFVGGAVVQVVGLALFPTLYRRVYGEPLKNPVDRA